MPNTVRTVLALITLLLVTTPLFPLAPATGGDELRQVVELLLDRVQQLEARIAQLESGGQTRVAAVPAAYELEPQPAPAQADATPTAFSESTRATHKSAYLPSRGWLEGMYYGSDTSKIEVHAFVDLEYIDAGPDGSRSGNSTFDNHHANIFVEADLRPNLGGHVEVEYEHSGDIVEIDQAYLEWAATDWLSLTAGRFYTPFGIERFVWYSPTNALVSRPEPMRQIIPGNFYANGVMAAGAVDFAERSTFTWELAVSDGLGDLAATSRRGSRQTRDNNSSRALTGRLAIAPGRNFEIGTSYHTQRYSDEEELDLGLDFLGIDFSGRYRGFELRAEWVDASLERAGRSDLEQDGYYTQLAYTFQRPTAFLPSISLVGRRDVVDLDGDVTGNDDQELFSFGVNTALHQHLRFKLEYRWASEDGPERDNDTFLSQFVIDF